MKEGSKEEYETSIMFDIGEMNDVYTQHFDGQILLYVNGEGFYRECGKESLIMHPRDSATISANLKHRHGATSYSWFPR